MSKYNRHQSVISKHSDSKEDEDNWIYKLEKSLVKDAVQPKRVDDSIFNQINNIMNGNSKYTSVEAAVEDMKNRSGLTAYLDKMNKTSKDEIYNTKIAEDQNSAKNNSMPIIITKCPQIKTTLENFIKDTKGNISIPAIIEKIKSIHQKDVSDAKDWDDEKFIRLVSKLNLGAKQQNPTNFEAHTNLGIMDNRVDDSDLDPSNTDAFHALNPTKL